MVKLNIESFRERIPEFSDTTETSDAAITLQWGLSDSFISHASGYIADSKREYSIQLVTAHLLKINKNTRLGIANSQISSAGEGRESTSFLTPPGGDQFEWWLNLTDYGKSALALLDVLSAGGFLVNGSAELGAFRKGGGLF